MQQAEVAHAARQPVDVAQVAAVALANSDQIERKCDGRGHGGATSLEGRIIEGRRFGLAAFHRCTRAPWPSVLGLRPAVGPAAIARLIVAVRVYSIQRTPRRARSHVGKKRLE